MSMKGRRARRRESEVAAQKVVECTSCGRRFVGGAWQVAHDPRWPGGCVPTSAVESLLTEVRGVWYSRGSEPR